jgi:hypothetical protein
VPSNLSAAEQELVDRLAPKLRDQRWRIDNLYFIKNEKGERVRFRPNLVQRDFLDNMHDFNVILKSRQLGFSTLIMIYMLDHCLFNRNHACGVIAQGLNEAQDLFQNKIRFAYDNMPQQIKDMVPALQDSARKMTFQNGSSITVGTSLRGGTNQVLHVSEYGKIAARYPEKAKEIKTGAFNTVHAGQKIFIESTAEGQGGEFYELCTLAQELEDTGKELTPLDPKFFFYPWYDDPRYILDEKPIVTLEMDKYFKKVEEWCGYKLADSQKAWYIKKQRLMGTDMLREFPSMPQDAFSAPLEGCYYGEELAWLRQNNRITSVPYDPKYLVHTFWDLGVRDKTTIWFFQQAGKEYRMIRYYENNNKGIQHYAEVMRTFGYKYGRHYMPHDGNHKSLDTGKELYATAREHGILPITIVPRTSDLKHDIQSTRNTLPKCYFDDVHCDVGIKHLASYRRKWNESLGVWGDDPLHDDASNGADAFRTFAIGYKEQLTKGDDRGHNEPEPSWMDW